MRKLPFTFALPFGANKPSEWDSYIVRRLSSMQGQYLDQHAYKTMLAADDRILYEVYELTVPPEAGELLHGLSVLHPGKVGSEYFMTKGHFHSVLETGEVYYCMNGTGMLVMETPEGEATVIEMAAGRVVYVPPRWAHRSVNTSATEDLITFFIYPGNAGHNYQTIEEKGFRKLVVEQDGCPAVIDNPRWQVAATEA